MKGMTAILNKTVSVTFKSKRPLNCHLFTTSAVQTPNLLNSQL